MTRCRRCGDPGETVYDGLCGRCLRVLIAMGEAADEEAADEEEEPLTNGEGENAGFTVYNR